MSDVNKEIFVIYTMHNVYYTTQQPIIKQNKSHFSKKMVILKKLNLLPLSGHWLKSQIVSR